MVKVVKLFIITILCQCSTLLWSQSMDTINVLGAGIVDKQAVYVGDIDSFVLSNINNPDFLINDIGNGKIFIEFYIDTLGCTTKHRIIKGIRKDVNSEVLKAVKLIKFEEPAMLRGKRVCSKYLIVVNLNKYSKEFESIKKK